MIKGEFQVTKRTLQRAVAVEMIRRQRDESKQELAWHDKRFVLCSLPIKRPPKGTLSYIRRNGNVTLSISTDPALGYSLPFGSFDRLTLLYLCTQAVRTRSSIIRFRSGAEILKASGWGLDGRSYRRLVASLHRLIGCSITVQRKDENEQVLVTSKNDAVRSLMSKGISGFASNAFRCPATSSPPSRLTVVMVSSLSRSVLASSQRLNNSRFS